jgi:hypothetical protein
LPRGGALLALGAGVAVVVLSVLNRRAARFDEFPPAPADAVYGPWWESVARAALPSTVVVGILGGVALAFSRGLAAFCGGLLAGLAILGLVTGILLVIEERNARARLYVTWSIVAPRRFAGPATSAGR